MFDESWWTWILDRLSQLHVLQPQIGQQLVMTFLASSHLPIGADPTYGWDRKRAHSNHRSWPCPPWCHGFGCPGCGHEISRKWSHHVPSLSTHVATVQVFLLAFPAVQRCSVGGDGSYSPVSTSSPLSSNLTMNRVHHHDHPWSSYRAVYSVRASQQEPVPKWGSHNDQSWRILWFLMIFVHWP